MSSGRHRASSRSTRSARSAGDGDATTTPRLRKWHKGFLGLAAVTVVGVGVAIGPSAGARNAMIMMSRAPLGPLIVWRTESVVSANR